MTNPRPHPIPVRFGDDELEQLRADAEAAGKPLATYLHDLMVAAEPQRPCGRCGGTGVEPQEGAVK